MGASHHFALKNVLKNKKGMAMLEMIPIIIIIVLLLNYSFGFWGSIHSGIMNSIAARNYAFETFSHKSSLIYFRSDPDKHFEIAQQRIHMIAGEHTTVTNINQVPTMRNINLFSIRGVASAETQGNESVHNSDVKKVSEGDRYTGEGVNPIWIKTAYGICLSSKCDQ